MYKSSIGVIYEYASVERILEAKTVAAAKPMAPASGLYLARVKYEFPWRFKFISFLQQWVEESPNGLCSEAE